ncbi:MAG: hypothetical protein E7K47_05800, partial [Acidovorax sp.]|nr:hypothetical protein [Acidovorax sp.]
MIDDRTDSEVSVDDHKWTNWKPEVFGDLFQRPVFRALPPKPEAPVQPEVAATPAANDDTPQAQTPPPSLYRRLRGLPIVGKLFSHPRIMNFLTRVRQRPGGATLKNLFITLAHAVAVRVPGVLRMRQVLAVVRHLPERVGALEWHIADGAGFGDFQL